MQGQGIVRIAIVVSLVALMSGASRAQCSGRGYYAPHHERAYAVAPAYREIVVGYGGGYGHARSYRHGHVLHRRHWGR